MADLGTVGVLHNYMISAKSPLFLILCGTGVGSQYLLLATTSIFTYSSRSPLLYTNYLASAGGGETTPPTPPAEAAPFCYVYIF